MFDKIFDVCFFDEWFYKMVCRTDGLKHHDFLSFIVCQWERASPMCR